MWLGNWQSNWNAESLTLLNGNFVSSQNYAQNKIATECLRDMDKLYLVKLGFSGWLGFRLKPIFTNAQAHFKSSQKWPKIIVSFC